MSYNIKGMLGHYGQARVFEEIAKHAPAIDFLCLQEVFEEKERPLDLTPLLARFPYFAYGANGFFTQGRLGNCTLSRLPITSQYNLDFSMTKKEDRGALFCEVSPQKELQVTLCNLHFGLGPFERRFQRQRLNEHIEKHYAQGPLIVCGDFNQVLNWPASFSSKKITKNFCKTLGLKERATFPSLYPFLSLDKIFGGPRIRPLAIRPLRGHFSKYSDHLPLVAEFSVS